MESAKLNNDELIDLILYAAKRNDIDINSIDSNEIKDIIKEYNELSDNFEKWYIKKLDTFKRAACLLVAISKNKLVYDKRTNASIALDAAYKMCEKPYWNVGDNYDIPEKIEEVDIDKAFEDNMEIYNMSKELLIDSIMYENSVPMNYWLNLQLFYQIALQLKHKSIKTENADETSKINEKEVKRSLKQKLLNIFGK